MLATNGPQWYDRRRPESTWPSIVVSVALTAALFASAFVAMQTVGRWTTRADATPQPPVILRFQPLPPVERPHPPARPATVPAVSPATSPAAAPSSAPDRVAPPERPVAPNAALPVAPPAQRARRDTGAVVTTAPSEIPLGIAPPVRSGRDTAMGAPPGGAVGQPSGVTIGSRTPNTRAYRDSVTSALSKGVPWLAATHAPKGAELAALQDSRRAALGAYRRTTTGGNANVHVMQGEGMGGEGAVGGGSAVRGGALTAGSGFSLPLLSKGPSAAQRRKNEAIDAEYQRGLRRLEDRILLARDSVRLDSLRRDSLRREAAARRRP